MNNFKGPEYFASEFPPFNAADALPDDQLKKMGCDSEILDLIHKLNTPEKIQEYMDLNFTYNHIETNQNFRDVIKSKKAHCFEGGISFAYPLLYVHGYHPKVILIEADQIKDVDHNVVIYRKNNSIGSVAMSSFWQLKDRPPIFSSVHEMMWTYYPYYTSEEKEWFGLETMIGYCTPLDLTSQFGTDWFFSKNQDHVDNLFNHYTDGLTCTDLFNGSEHPYAGN